MSELKKQYALPLYRLKRDIPLAKAGTIFYYDREDMIKGSLAEGCMKMAWREDGNCQNGLCADTITFHANARAETEWFEPIAKDSAEKIVEDLSAFELSSSLSLKTLHDLQSRAKKLRGEK